MIGSFARVSKRHSSNVDTGAGAEGAPAFRASFDQISVAKRVQMSAVFTQPVFWFVHVWHGLADETPEPMTVVHLLQMRHLMGRDILQNFWWSEDETPGK